MWGKRHGHWINIALRRKQLQYGLKQRTFWTYHIMVHDHNSEHILLLNGKTDWERLCAFLAFSFVSQPTWLKQADTHLHTDTLNQFQPQSQSQSVCLLSIHEASTAHLASVTLFLEILMRTYKISVWLIHVVYDTVGLIVAYKHKLHSAAELFMYCYTDILVDQNHFCQHTVCNFIHYCIRQTPTEKSHEIHIWN